MPTAGDLWARVTLQARTMPQDSTGAEIASYSDWQAVWGNIEALGQSRLTQVDRLWTETADFKIIIRYVSGLTPNHRIIFESRTFSISGIVCDERNKTFQTIYAKEIQL